MKKYFLQIGLMLAVAAVFFWGRPAWSESSEKKVFSKRQDLALLESAAPSAKAVGKARWNEELTVLQHNGRWLKVSGADGEGWVYIGNVAPEKIPEENRNDMPMKASGMTASAAGRGLSDGAEAYAGRHSLAEVAEQVTWVEKLNAGISREEARAYLKSHKLGEFAEAK